MLVPLSALATALSSSVVDAVAFGGVSLLVDEELLELVVLQLRSARLATPAFADVPAAAMVG